MLRQSPDPPAIMPVLERCRSGGRPTSSAQVPRRALDLAPRRPDRPQKAARRGQRGEGPIARNGCAEPRERPWPAFPRAPRGNSLRVADATMPDPRSHAAADTARCRITAKIASVRMRRFNLCADYFRSTPMNGHARRRSACLKRARAQSRCAPARCAGARAERPVAAERTAIAGLPRLTRVLSACNA
jgi:hypothetical protein